MKGPFEYVNALSTTKDDIVRNYHDPEQMISGYDIWLTNATFSYFADSCLYANEMNKYSDTIPSIMQYDFYMLALRKRKRFTKHAKKIITDDLDAISKYYKCNFRRAEEYREVLTEKQIEKIKQETYIGGKT